MGRRDAGPTLVWLTCVVGPASRRPEAPLACPTIRDSPELVSPASTDRLQRVAVQRHHPLAPLGCQSGSCDTRVERSTVRQFDSSTESGHPPDTAEFRGRSCESPSASSGKKQTLLT